jgi:hypothetical protein
VLAGGLAAAGVAAAASGTFSVGSVVPTGESTVAPDHRTTVDQRVLAEGTTPVAGPWGITAYQSERMVDSRGAEMQPPGVPCLSLILRHPPKGISLVSRWFCGERGEDGFNATGVPLEDASGHGEVVLFGQSPEAASMVELVTDGGGRIRARTHEGPADYLGDVWVIAAPPGMEDRNPQVHWMDPAGRSRGQLDVAQQFEDRVTPPPSR